MIKIIVTGICGRMGKLIAAHVYDAEGVELVGGTECPGHEKIGKDIGKVIDRGILDILVSDDLAQIIEKADVVIDFTSPVPTMNNLEIVLKQRKAMVIGTTGIDKEQREKISEAGKEIPIVFAPNMSIGVNLLFNILGDIAKKLGPDYDIEIVEAHHKFKKDSPSGTAMHIAEILANAGNRDLEDVGTYGRHWLVGAREKGEIAIHAVRAGDIVGEHTVIFGGMGERIEISHKAHSRETFVRGAIRAAQFLAGKEKGFFSMQDVLM